MEGGGQKQNLAKNTEKTAAKPKKGKKIPKRYNIEKYALKTVPINRNQDNRKILLWKVTKEKYV